MSLPEKFTRKKIFYRPRRFIFDKDGIQGVLVTISLPEFEQVTDAEIYVTIEANTKQIYDELLNLTNDECKIEVITFRPEHWAWTENVISIDDIHHYKLFGFNNTGNNKEVNANARIANEFDLDWFSKLSEQIPAKSARSYLRALQFQLACLPYINFLSPKKGEPKILVCVRKHCSYSWQIHHAISITNNSDEDLLTSTLKYALWATRTYSPIVIWRLKDFEYQRYSAIIDSTEASLLTQERHLHFSR